MESPFIVLIELIFGLISRATESIGFMFLKILEFFASLGTVSGIFGILAVALIGGIVITLVLKFFFKTSKSLLFLWVILILLGVVFLVFLIMTYPASAPK